MTIATTESTITDHEAAQVERANATGATPVVFAALCDRVRAASIGLVDGRCGDFQHRGRLLRHPGQVYAQGGAVE